MSDPHQTPTPGDGEQQGTTPAPPWGAAPPSPPAAPPWGATPPSPPAAPPQAQYGQPQYGQPQYGQQPAQYGQFTQSPAQAYQQGGWQEGWVPELGVQIGSAGARIGAKVIDVVIILTMMFVVAIVGTAVMLSTSDTDSFTTSFGGGLGTSNLLLGLVVGLVTLLIDFVYNVVLVAQFGATPGKLMLGLRIIPTNGTPIDTSVAFKRWSPILGLSLLGLVPFVAFFANLGRLGLVVANLVMILTDERRRDVFDRVADTYVVTVR